MLSIAALLTVSPKSFTCSARTSHLRLNELGLNSDQFLGVFGLEEFLGKLKGRHNIALGEVHCLIADILRADLTRLNSIFKGGNCLLCRTHIASEGGLGLFDAVLGHDTHLVGNIELWGWVRGHNTLPRLTTFMNIWSVSPP